jgi:hypothetical protein
VILNTPTLCWPFPTASSSSLTRVLLNGSNNLRQDSLQEIFLKTKISKVRLSENGKYLLLTGYDGRVSLQLIHGNSYQLSHLENWICFKAHDVPSRNTICNLYQINDCGFILMPQHKVETFYTCGGNGVMSFWELIKKEKVRNFSTEGNFFLI